MFLKCQLVGDLMDLFRLKRKRIVFNVIDSVINQVEVYSFDLCDDILQVDVFFVIDMKSWQLLF